MSEIVEVIGREVLDSRGNPTVEAEVELASGATGALGTRDSDGPTARFASATR